MFKENTNELFFSSEILASQLLNASKKVNLWLSNKKLWPDGFLTSFFPWKLGISAFVCIQECHLRLWLKNKVCNMIWYIRYESPKSQWCIFTGIFAWNMYQKWWWKIAFCNCVCITHNIDVCEPQRNNKVFKLQQCDFCDNKIPKII